jgi:hypothetical protein
MPPLCSGNLSDGRVRGGTAPSSPDGLYFLTSTLPRLDELDIAKIRQIRTWHAKTRQIRTRFENKQTDLLQWREQPLALSRAVPPTARCSAPALRGLGCPECDQPSCVLVWCPALALDMQRDTYHATDTHSPSQREGKGVETARDKSRDAKQARRPLGHIPWNAGKHGAAVPRHTLVAEELSGVATRCREQSADWHAGSSLHAGAPGRASSCGRLRSPRSR